MGTLLTAATAFVPALMLASLQPWFAGAPFKISGAALGHAARNALALLDAFQGVPVHSSLGGPGIHVLPGGGLMLLGVALSLGAWTAARITRGSQVRRAAVGVLVPTLVALAWFVASFWAPVPASVGSAHLNLLGLSLLWALLFGSLGAVRGVRWSGTRRLAQARRLQVSLQALTAGGRFAVLPMLALLALGAVAVVSEAPHPLAVWLGNAHHVVAAVVAALLLAPNLLAAAVVGALGAPAHWTVTFLASATGGFVPHGTIATPFVFAVALLLGAVFGTVPLPLARSTRACPTSWAR